MESALCLRSLSPIAYERHCYQSVTPYIFETYVQKEFLIVKLKRASLEESNVFGSTVKLNANKYPFICWVDLSHRLMGGAQSPSHWRGGLNVTYNIGPGFKSPYRDW